LRGERLHPTAQNVCEIELLKDTQSHRSAGGKGQPLFANARDKLCYELALVAGLQKRLSLLPLVDFCSAFSMARTIFLASRRQS
jgi:hypothetical protein